MNFLIISVLFFVAIDAESYIPNSADPNNPDQCFHKELKLLIKKGETIKPTNVELCAGLTCQGEGLILVSQCPRVLGLCENAIYVPTDFTKPYPDCCEHYKCPK